MLDAAQNGPSRRSSSRPRLTTPPPKPTPSTPRSTSNEWRCSFAATPSLASSSTTQRQRAMRPPRRPSPFVSASPFCRPARAKKTSRPPRQRYRQAQAAADLMQRGYRKEDIDAGRAKMDEAQARVNQLDVQLKEAELSAPADGIVQTSACAPATSSAREESSSPCSNPRSSGSRSTCPRPTSPHVRVGQPAQVEVDSLPRSPLHRPHPGDRRPGRVPSPQRADPRRPPAPGLRRQSPRRQPRRRLKSGMSATVRLQ